MEKTMAKKRDTWVSPVGSTVDADHKADLADDEYRAEHERLAPFEALARIVITRRAVLAISQAELARRMGTTPSVVSRIESGQHATNSKTLKRLAEALEGRAVLGVEFGPPDAPERELVVL
jgi:ribosome-binding protein aMBF1 (putative translation factor)